MTITLDGLANDGAPGEGDNIGSDFEAIDGTASPDVFTGSPGPDQFSGGFGNDEIHGGAGDDQLYGSGDDDKVYGDAGNDKVEGANGADIVDGGPGTDQIYGDIGSCSFSCSFDADTLLSRDGEQDAVDCGGGADTAQVDFVDIVAFCAAVDRAPAPSGAGAGPGGAPSGGGPGAGGTPPPAAAGASAATLKLTASVSVKALIKRGLSLQFTCPGPCAISVELRRGSAKVGAARKSLLAAGTTKVVVKVTKASRSKVRRLRRGRLTVRVKVTDAAGKTTTITRTVKLKA
jgi:hypothetical protein